MTKTKRVDVSGLCDMREYNDPAKPATQSFDTGKSLRVHLTFHLFQCTQLLPKISKKLLLGNNRTINGPGPNIQRRAALARNEDWYITGGLSRIEM